MNRNNLHQIFQHYMDRFEFINAEPQTEYYKWQVCNDYPILMKDALAASSEEFSSKLYDVKRCTYNIIDSYTQPFYGLVEFAKDEPETVRKVFLDLYVNDNGDLKIRMDKISDFIKRSRELLEKYTPGSFLYKQDSHSVSSYLFLNDPDNHYMYKATESLQFADCIEFYDDWGSGDNIRLDAYHRMCDELIDEIKACDPLLNVDQARYDGRIDITGGVLHPDREKHILAFDIIYCCRAYDLFDGISYTKRNAKEKQQFINDKKKAEALLAEYNKAKETDDMLKEALACFVNMVGAGDTVTHKKYGAGTILHIDDRVIRADYSGQEKEISLPIGISNGLIRFDQDDFDGKAEMYRDILKRFSNIPKTLDYTVRALEPYREYLE